MKQDKGNTPAGGGMPDVEVGDDLISSPVTPHTATRVAQDWAVSWLPGRLWPKAHALTAVRIAALVTLPLGSVVRELIPALASDLGLPADDAIARAAIPSAPLIPAPAVTVGPVRSVSGLDFADAMVAVHEAYDIPEDLSAPAARRLLSERRRAVELLVADAPSRPGLTAEALAWDVQRLRRVIAQTHEEIVETDRAKRAERAAKKAEAAEQAEAQVPVDEPTLEAVPDAVEPIASVSVLPRRRTSVLFDRSMVGEIVNHRQAVIDLRGRPRIPSAGRCSGCGTGRSIVTSGRTA